MMTARGAVLFAAGLMAACVVSFNPAHADAIDVRAASIPLYPDQPGERRAGALLYRGGLLLSSGDKRFGGWSDLAVSADGGELLAVSDEAHWLRARLSYSGAGDLAGLNAADIAAMVDLDGKPMRGKAGDAEGLTLERANDLNGPAVVSFERDVRLWRYDLSQGFTARPVNVAIGPWVEPLRNNSQLEALTLLNPDTLLVFAESKIGTEDIRGALEAYPGSGQARTRTLSVIPHDPFGDRCGERAGRRNLYPATALFFHGRRRHGIAPCGRGRAARRRAPRRRGAGQPVVSGHQHRQHGRHRGTPRPKRRDAAVSHLGQ